MKRSFYFISLILLSLFFLSGCSEHKTGKAVTEPISSGISMPAAEHTSFDHFGISESRMEQDF